MLRADQAKDRPTKADWTDVKRILKYLWGVSKYRLLYGAGNSKGVLQAFSDANFAGDGRTRLSTSGVVAVYAGSVIAWSSHLQRSLALSTTEAEFIAASERAKELIWLKRMLGELGGKGNEVPTLYRSFATRVSQIKMCGFFRRDF
jgi:hypothetical protein